MTQNYVFSSQNCFIPGTRPALDLMLSLFSVPPTVASHFEVCFIRASSRAQLSQQESNPINIEEQNHRKNTSIRIVKHAKEIRK